MWTVYLLRDPIVPNVCYVGMTGGAMAKRLNNHRLAARTERSPRAQWLNALFTLGLSPSVEILGRFDSQEAAGDAEKQFIACYRADTGIEMMNRALGGYHVYDQAFRVSKLKEAFARPAERARKARASRKVTREKWKDPESRARRVAGMRAAWTEERKERMRGLWANPEHRATRLAAQKAAFAKPEEKARKSAATKQRYESAAARAATAASTSASWSDPDTRRRRSEGISKALRGRPKRRST